ncbi:MAG: hypothetical protein V3S55_13380 [Nitrospiraceae bacterium]
MRKLLVVTLFATMMLSAQETERETCCLANTPECNECWDKFRELTEVETLQVSIVLKDLLILQLSIDNLNARFQTLTNQKSNMQAGLDRMIERLRVVHEAPADEFEFNPATLKFTPIPPTEPEGE